MERSVAGAKRWIPTKSAGFDFLAAYKKSTAWPSDCTRVVNLTIASVDGRAGTNTCLTYQTSDVIDEAAVERKLGDYTFETVDWLRKNPVPASSDAQHAVMAALATLYPCNH